MKRVEILYFAWLRERMGQASETVDIPDSVRSIGGLIDFLVGRGPRHAAAFASRATIRAAVNQEFADAATPVSDGDEVAFFPPVTGG